MSEIGGYFELELNKDKGFHPGAIRLNSGKNCLVYILKVNEYKKLYIPYYTCEVVLQQCVSLGIDYEFYCIDQNLDPEFKKEVKSNEALLYTNYFGIKDATVLELSKKFNNLIIDNAQSFFSRQIKGVDSFYSARKFFGVPDGAYLYSNKVLSEELTRDKSFARFSHLLKRIDLGAEAGYPDFKSNEDYLSKQPIRTMSEITQALLCNINYEEVIRRRKRNFMYLHNHLGKSNMLRIPDDSGFIPMVYPFLSDQHGLRDHLISNRIFVARYWSHLLESSDRDTIEYFLASEMLPLPVDQRYDLNDMRTIISTVLSYA